MKYLATLFMAIFAAMLLSTPAMAIPLGTLNVSNCAGGGVTITATTIDFTLPVGGGNGCIATGSGTNVFYPGGTLLPGVQGSVLDLTVGGGPVPDFMTFVGNPILHFDLTSLGPGVANSVCAAVLDPNLPGCSVVAGSPFVFTPTATGTALSLSATGIARDGSATNSVWIGTFTTQIAGLTPAQIQAIVLGGGSVSSTYSGSFSVNVVPQVPEPATMLLLGTGLAGIAVKVRKRRKAV